MWTGQRVQEKKNHRAARDETCALVCGFCSLCRELIPPDSSGRFVGVCRAVCKADRCGRRCNRTGVILFCKLKFRGRSPETTTAAGKADRIVASI